ncbi:serine/threonine-protein phosphatase [Blastococcus sp. CT_GayMR16]|nr:serine/threonine-protein phosphatase [Blastococcus sp. CT_GayMR16]
MPLTVLALFTVLDLAAGRGQQALSLTVISPLVAATTLGRRATAAYGVLAVLVSALLGIYDQQYTSEAAPTQFMRLFGVAVGSGVALFACTLRLRGEARLRQASAQAAASGAVVELAETLQRNLLGDPPRVDGLETAVRYLPATRHARVGGDWYDAFPVPDGTTMLVIGDVAGHDAPAAATMSETRGMLRAIAQSTVGSPAAVLAVLDTALANLRMRTLVTALVAAVDVRRTRDSAGVTLCWSNAGHPAPVLVCADGSTQLLERPADRLLGVSPDAARHDHTLVLQPGDTVLFYTDGLVEQPDVALDDGTAWLVGRLRRLGTESLDRLCDDLLAGMSGPIDDDVALLAVRVPPRAQAPQR